MTRRDPYDRRRAEDRAAELERDRLLRAWRRPRDVARLVREIELRDVRGGAYKLVDAHARVDD